MSLKLVVLKSGENIITDIKEGFYEEKLVCYLLEKPCVITINGSYKILDDEEDTGNRISITLHPWPSLSKQTTIEIPPDWVVTIVDPNDELKNTYKNQVLGIVNDEIDQINSSDEQSDLGLTD